jgi:6-pyruvoyltetrahydropterin/6-carboxytetrahydropterin synthase
MFDIFIKTHFSGGHHLRQYPGNCERPHGHNWKVKVTVRALELDALGMGIDFKALKQQVNAVVDALDHRDLNEHPAFQACNPSSEHIARFLFDQLQMPLTTGRYTLHSVEVRETDTSGVIYYGA